MIRVSHSLTLALTLLALYGCQASQPHPQVEDKSRQARLSGAVVRYYQAPQQPAAAAPTNVAPTPASATPSVLAPLPPPPDTGAPSDDVRVYQTAQDSAPQPQRLPHSVPAAPAPQPLPTGTDQDSARQLTPDDYRQLASSFFDGSFFQETLAEYQATLNQLQQELASYRAQLSRLSEQASRYWGTRNLALPSTTQLVKYTDQYRSRGEMDFGQGKIVVETVEDGDYRRRLHQAIVATLLTPDNARDPKLFSAMNIDYQGPSILAGQVLDHEGIPVRWAWRANRYANYLVTHKLQRMTRDGRTIYRVEIPMVQNHVQVRGQKYETLVRKYARKYNIPEPLVYGIMETESSFNPYAMSHIPAYGLMQVVPATAGRDVFQRIKRRNDQPDKRYLFNAANNIDTGTAYLSILRDIYLKDVRHPLSKEYCMISAYNGGAGNVLRTFAKDRQEAVRRINQLTPEQVYQRLRQHHPSREARRYLHKVVTAKQKYELLAQRQNGANRGG